MSSKGLMLAFYRSADWCPYCKTQLAELETRVVDLKKNGLGLAAPPGGGAINGVGRDAAGASV